MMHLREHPDWHAVVADNWPRTTAYLLAFREPCITIRNDELEAIRENRVLVDLAASAFVSWTPEGSWFLAVLLCPGDGIEPLVRWVEDRRVHPDRVHFYAHPDVDVFEALQPWGDAGLAAPKVEEGIASWGRLHKRFGLDLSIQILRDWG